MRLLRHLVEDAIHLCRSRDRPSRNFLFTVPPPKTHPLSPQGLLFPWNHSSENALANMPGTPPRSREESQVPRDHVVGTRPHVTLQRVNGLATQCRRNHVVSGVLACPLYCFNRFVEGQTLNDRCFGFCVRWKEREGGINIHTLTRVCRGPAVSTPSFLDT